MRISRLTAYLIGFAPVLLVPARASGQIVNIESILVGEPTPGVHGALQLGFRLLKGNSEYRQVEGNGLVRWRGGDHIVQLVAGGTYKAAGEKRVADNSMGHLRYGYVLTERLRVEALVQIQQNAFVRLQRRLLSGAGFRAGIYDGTIAAPTGDVLLERRFDLGFIIMYEDEKLRGAVSKPGWRASILASAGWAISESVFINCQVYTQPLLSDLKDLRMLSDCGLTVRVLGPLSVQISARLIYDSRPPAEVETTDLELRNTLAITF